jgi:hypothetical protein
VEYQWNPQAIDWENVTSHANEIYQPGESAGTWQQAIAAVVKRHCGGAEPRLLPPWGLLRIRRA